jgi:hypothetical protein
LFLWLSLENNIYLCRCNISTNKTMFIWIISLWSIKICEKSNRINYAIQIKRNRRIKLWKFCVLFDGFNWFRYQRYLRMPEKIKPLKYSMDAHK